MSKLTKTQALALKMLKDHGGEGVFDKKGRLVARGVVLGDTCDSEEWAAYSTPFKRTTWARLVDAGVAKMIGTTRVRVVEGV